MEAVYGFSGDHARRGEKDGSIICHKCDDNREGFCSKYHKWCNLVRQYCEPKVTKEVAIDTEVQDKKDPGFAWRAIYGSKDRKTAMEALEVEA